MQADQPIWAIVNFPDSKQPALHLSYHDGQHYNSVRMAHDYSHGSPAAVQVREATVSADASKVRRDDVCLLCSSKLLQPCVVLLGLSGDHSQ